MGRVLSPQEKKALSYAKDRRNDYGENDKSSRKSIRKRKRYPNRCDRHNERRVLAGATGVGVDVAVAETVERLLTGKTSKWYTAQWRKWRDAALGEIVERRLRRRERAGMDNPALVQMRIQRVRRRRYGHD